MMPVNEIGFVSARMLLPPLDLRNNRSTTLSAELELKSANYAYARDNSVRFIPSTDLAGHDQNFGCGSV
jgi:hypothetical protein